MGSESQGMAAPAAAPSPPTGGGQLGASNSSGMNYSNVGYRMANHKGSSNFEAGCGGELQDGGERGVGDSAVKTSLPSPPHPHPQGIALAGLESEQAAKDSKRAGSMLLSSDICRIEPAADGHGEEGEGRRSGGEEKSVSQVQMAAPLLESELQKARRTTSPFRLSNSSSAPSQHDARHLDPGAQEFTPGPGTYPGHLHAPVALVHHPLDGSFLPSSAATGMEVRPFVYGHEYNGGAMFPFYAHESHIGYGSSPCWDGQTMGIAMQGELNPSAPLLPPPVLVQPPQLSQHFGLPPYGLPSPTPAMVHVPYSCPPSIALQTPAVTCAPPSSVWREHMSRALQLIGVPMDVSDGQLRRELEQWGEIRAVQLEGRKEGVVTVHYFDLRSARAALTDIQHQHLMQQRRMQDLHQFHQRQQHGRGDESEDAGSRAAGFLRVPLTQDVAETVASTRGIIGGKAVWAQYTIPVGLATSDSHNQGTLVVFNLDADMPIDVVRATFERYGSVKELRETPSKRQHKFVEFFDIRDAAAALNALDGHEIGGKKVKIEFSRPGGQARRARAQSQISSSSIAGQPNRFDPVPASMPVRGQPVYMGWGSDLDSAAAAQMSYLWSNYAHVGAAAAGFPSQHPLNEQQAHFHGAYGLPMHTKTFAPMQAGAQGPIVGGAGSRPASGIASTQRFFTGSGHSQAGSVSGKGGGKVVFEGPPRRKKGNGPVLTRMDSMNNLSSWADVKVGARGCLGAGARSNSIELQAQYKFNETEAESSAANARTTLMIRNIPNKYSQQMLLALLDEHCVHVNSQIVDPGEPISAYDFVYLPIDFKNRCNLGYAFVNFTTAQATVKVHKAFNGRQWEEFNSRKICEVTYARVQGRAALEDHFRNSRFACDTDEYLPLVFSPPRTGLECPSPRVVGAQLSDSSGNPSGLRNSNSVHEDGDSAAAMGDMNWDPAALAQQQRRALGSSSLSSSCVEPQDEDEDAGAASSSSGRNWTGVGIALGRRLSGHHRGLIQQGQRFGRVM